ncbi:MAG: YHS domain protein [Phycisphaerae bacterium]|nr:YHS domain protein [Phycisphaerae bacterium]
MNYAVLAAALSLASVAPAVFAHAEPPAPARSEAPRDLTHYNLEKGQPAIQGYDPVAYFPEGGGKPLMGKKQFAHTHRGVTYWFASQANLERFVADPERFEPTYGGWCASAMADGGRKVEIDPKNFRITGDRLYLFYKSLFQNAVDYWKKDEPANIARADENWKSLTGETPRR